MIKNINKDDLTIDGILATEINECNELLMMYIIKEKLIENLSPNEIVPILALFVEDKINENPIIPENLPDNIQEITKKIINKNEEFGYYATKYNVYYKCDMNTDFSEIALDWANNVTLREIIRKYDIYEGNFIRNIQKINNICVELIEVYDILNNTVMIEKLKEIEKLIIKDVVTFISLYIN